MQTVADQVHIVLYDLGHNWISFLQVYLPSIVD